MGKKKAANFIYEDEYYKIRKAAFEVWKEFREVFKENVMKNSLISAINRRIYQRLISF